MRKKWVKYIWDLTPYSQLLHKVNWRSYVPNFAATDYVFWDFLFFLKKHEFWRRGWSLEISRGCLATPSTRFRWRTLSHMHAFADARFRQSSLWQTHTFAVIWGHSLGVGYNVDSSNKVIRFMSLIFFSFTFDVLITIDPGAIFKNSFSGLFIMISQSYMMQKLIFAIPISANSIFDPYLSAITPIVHKVRGWGYFKERCISLRVPSQNVGFPITTSREKSFMASHGWNPPVHGVWS